MVQADDRAPAAATVLMADTQTGLPTLVALCADLQRRLERGGSLSLIILSLDGQPAPGTADEHAPELAQIVIEGAHSSPDGQPYRIAADSFALLLPEISRAAALQLAERLRLRVERQGGGLTATLAVAGAPEDAAEVGALIAVCEAALIGGAGARNRVHAATPVESLPPGMARLANLLIARMVALMELGQRLREKEREAMCDPVSGLPNSRAFEQALPRYLARCQRAGVPLAVLLVDGDNLKAYNTTLGYHAGDEWIRRIGRTLASHLRPGDYVARWFVGDEFVVLLPGATEEQAQEVAERLRHAVAAQQGDAEPVGTVSIGIAVAQDDLSGTAGLLDQARDALLAAKGRGKNQVSS